VTGGAASREKREEAPILGEDTESVLREMGYSVDEIKTLKETGTVLIPE
jgi:crotonobetainyl-CoA:carnitine CoA-transferase CaiB-like acyl-CoA transferase